LLFGKPRNDLFILVERKYDAFSSVEPKSTSVPHWPATPITKILLATQKSKLITLKIYEDLANLGVEHKAIRNGNHPTMKEKWWQKSYFSMICKLIPPTYTLPIMGVGSGDRRAVLPPWIFIHSADLVNKG